MTLLSLHTMMGAIYMCISYHFLISGLNNLSTAGMLQCLYEGIQRRVS